VSPPDNARNRSAWVYHFDPADNAVATLHRDAPFPQSSVAVLFGGQNNNRHSMRQLQDVQVHLGHQNVKIEGVYNSPGLWVDANGNYFVHATERATAERDGTLPQPAPQP
jgi:hypothetical protein